MRWPSSYTPDRSRPAQPVSVHAYIREGQTAYQPAGRAFVGGNCIVAKVDDRLVVDKGGVKAQAEAAVLPPGKVVIPAHDGENCAQDRQHPPDDLRHAIWALGHLDGSFPAPDRP